MAKVTRTILFPDPIVASTNYGDTDAQNAVEAFDPSLQSLYIGRTAKLDQESTAFLHFDVTAPSIFPTPIPSNSSILRAWLRWQVQRPPVGGPGKFRVGILTPGAGGDKWRGYGFRQGFGPQDYFHAGLLPHPTANDSDAVNPGVITFNTFLGTVDWDATNHADGKIVTFGNPGAADQGDTHFETANVQVIVELFRLIEATADPAQTTWPSFGFVLDPFETAAAEQRVWIHADDNPNPLFTVALFVDWEGRVGIVDAEIGVRDRLGTELELEDRIDGGATVEARVGADCAAEDRVEGALVTAERIGGGRGVEPCD